jgi:hypothetical protein
MPTFYEQVTGVKCLFFLNRYLQLQELGNEVIVANVGELRAISHTMDLLLVLETPQHQVTPSTWWCVQDSCRHADFRVVIGFGE